MRALSAFDQLSGAMSDARVADGSVVTELMTLAKQVSPGVTDLLLRAALPRAFDLTMLATLAGTEADDADFVSDLGWLLSSPFLHERSGGSWSVHDSIRGPLLALWATRPDYLEQSLGVLEDVHQARYDRARQALAALGQTEGLIREAAPSRYVTLSDQIQDRLIRAGIDSVHTALRRSFELGWVRMVGTFNDLVENGLVHQADMVVRGWSAASVVVGDEDRVRLEEWAEYFMAASAIQRRRFRQALEHLDALDPDRFSDLRLLAWSQKARAEAMRGLTRFDEALESVEAAIATHQRYRMDDTNIAKPWMDKAALHALMRSTTEQVDAAREALRIARELPAASDDITSARVTLADACAAAGDVEEAVANAVQAVSWARRSVARDEAGTAAAANRRATLAAIDILGPLSSRLLATLVEQTRQLSLAGGADAWFDILVARTAAALRGGDPSSATATLQEARALVEERLSGRAWEIDAEEAQHADELGDPARGAVLNLRLLADPVVSADAWTRARCQGNALWDLMLSGRYDEARSIAEDARRSWEDMRHRRNVQLVDLMRSDLARRTGDLDEAERILDTVGTVVDTPYEGFRHECRARLLHARGAYEAAADVARDAWRTSSAAEDPVMRVRRGLLAVECLTVAGRREEALRVHAGVTALLDQLAAFSGWRPSEEQTRADEHAGRAVRILVAGLGRLPARARSAYEHLETAMDLDGTAGWYHLEAAWCLMLLERPRQASRHLDKAAGLFADPALRSAVARQGDGGPS